MTRHPAILAEGLGKCYKLSSGTHYYSLRSLLKNRADFLRHRKQPRTDFWALRNASFSIDHGENVGIVGLNGAGKSTLLKILSRITQPTIGRAAIDGRVGALLEVGTGFHLELTGRENAYLYGSILGMRREEVRRKFDAIVSFAGIEKHLDTPVKRYSSGMYVRLAFAVAAHLEPEILFLDEVLAVGDLAFQRKCFDFVKTLQQRDAAILFVSHNMFSIKNMCQRVIYLRQGEVQYDGPVDGGIELYERDSRLSTLAWNGSSKPEDWPIFVTHCEVRDANDQKRTLFDIGETMRLAVEYQIRTPLSSPNFMISLVRSDGTVCCTYSTELDGIDLGRLSEDGRIELEIPILRIVAEMYSIQITVREKGFQQILCNQIGMTFHIRDAMLEPNFGVFHEPGEWRLPATLDSSIRSAHRHQSVDA
ncbi:MAG: ABC transporter ATP-binding protein [Burkholderiales bacterium]|nr:ABC transporter ATP-binding protein [Burkholderiales bacterium]